MSTALIVGVAGFLGRYAAREFIRLGWRVVGLDIVPPENGPHGIIYFQMPLPSPELATLLRAESPQVCINAAGRASVPLSMENPADDFRDNAVLTFELLEALRRDAPHCRFLFLSSAAVYGNPMSLPVSESHAIMPLSPYGYHKRQGELLCEEFSKIYAVPTASLRLFSAYGPGLRRQVIWDMCERVFVTGALQLRGTGEESRDFIHAADVARALAMLATDAPCGGEIYNIASGREVSIAELAALVLAELGTDIVAQFDGAETPGQPRNWRADTARAASLGFTTSVVLEQGLSGVAAWCRAELGNA